MLPYKLKTRVWLFRVLMTCWGLLLTFMVGSVGLPAHWLANQWPWIAGGGVVSSTAGWFLLRWDRHLSQAGRPAVRRPSTWLMGGIGSSGAALFQHATVNQTAILAGAVGGFFLGLAIVVSPTDFIGGT